MVTKTKDSQIIRNHRYRNHLTQ